MQLEQLSPRETDVVRLVAMGLSNPEISHELRISYSTTRTHLENISRKWCIQGRIAIAVLAIGRYVDLHDAQHGILKRSD